MAENRDQDQPRVAQPDDAERMRRAAREAAATADHPATETVPGGKYLVGDTYVDAAGTPLKDKG